ncbi:hypothetical protein F4778DRAFT_163002 [Xylariomycetidae sp. FL2044]|nr:hypothetical protein F4778DRAFT_163002 [Xylariomycetidae sp. FL2044]
MSIRISLDNPPVFYTNLDFISGRVILSLTRPETIGNVIVKLEGESRTALAVPMGERDDYSVPGNSSGNVITENHKILYRVYQVYPDDGVALPFQPGQHEFKFNFKVPLNNICHDPKAMSALMGIGGIGNPGLLGMGGFRTMDGTKQLMLQHVKATLPPSLTGFPQEAEIRYYIKVTIQRPGIFKENWRYQVGFKFLPIEPPRPKKTNQEAFARRPFTFKPQTPLHHRRSFFGSKPSSPNPSAAEAANQMPPSMEVSARVPHPSILTCNQPLPLRLITKKLAPANEQVYLIGLEIALVGYTQVRVQNLSNTERTTWIIVSAPNLSIALGKPTDAVDAEFEVPNHLWASRPIPNTVAPSFRTCNLARRYELELKVSLSWGAPPSSGSSSRLKIGGGHQPLPQQIHLPLKLSNVEIFTGIKPPEQLLHHLSSAPSTSATNQNAPKPPPRPRPQQTATAPAAPQRPPANDPLYPPQLGPGGQSQWDDAPPPSYDEAMADQLVGPSIQERPAYSGVTAENAPSTIPNGEKGG